MAHFSSSNPTEIVKLKLVVYHINLEGIVTMKLNFLMLFWIVIGVIYGIALSYILATLSVLAIPFVDKFNNNLTDIRIIALAFFFGTITTVAVYFIDSRLLQRER